MIKSIAILSALIMLSLGAMAKADVGTPIWSCELQSTRLHGGTLGLGLSLTSVRGQGVVHCTSLIGRDEMNTPVHVRLVGVGVGIGAARINQIMVRVASVGVATPQDLYGTFKLQGSVSLTVLSKGASADLYTAVNDIGVSAGLGFTGYEGFGLDLKTEVQGVEIRPKDFDDDHHDFDDEI